MRMLALNHIDTGRSGRHHGRFSLHFECKEPEPLACHAFVSELSFFCSVLHGPLEEVHEDHFNGELGPEWNGP